MILDLETFLPTPLHLKVMKVECYTNSKKIRRKEIFSLGSDLDLDTMNAVCYYVKQL